MANREALRELQSRLAQRLSVARTEPRAASWLAFECAGQGVLVPLPTAGEIFPVGPLTAVPHTQPWFVGVANLRGLLHGVVDLAAFLGLRDPAQTDAAADRLRGASMGTPRGAPYGPASGTPPGTPPGAPRGTSRDTLRDQARLLAFNAALGSHCALWVDRLAGLRGAHQLRAAPTPGPARPAFAVALWHDAEGRAWQEIDLAALAAHEQFLAIAA